MRLSFPLHAATDQLGAAFVVSPTARKPTMPEIHPATQHLLDLFDYQHLPPHLQAVSKPLGLIAIQFAENLGGSPELTAGLRKLLEAKDCFVRQAVIDARSNAE